MARYDFTTRRLYVDAPLAHDARVELDRAQAHYLCNVLRLGEGAELLAFNGRDGEWLTTLTVQGRKSAALLAKNRTRPQETGGDLHYLFAPLKQARLDYSVQKAVEMGASLLQPVLTRHTHVERVNEARMHANAIEAAEQCGILALPRVASPVRLDALLAAWPSERLLIFCDEDAEGRDPVAVLQAARREFCHNSTARRSDRAGRRIRAGRTGSPSGAALRSCGCPSVRAFCAPIRPPSPLWRWFRRFSAIGAADVIAADPDVEPISSRRNPFTILPQTPHSKMHGCGSRVNCDGLVLSAKRARPPRQQMAAGNGRRKWPRGRVMTSSMRFIFGLLAGMAGSGAMILASQAMAQEAAASRQPISGEIMGRTRSLRRLWPGLHLRRRHADLRENRRSCPRRTGRPHAP